MPNVLGDLALKRAMQQFQSPYENMGNRYGTNTPKGEGWLGILKRPDGDISTELSTGFLIDGKEMEVPLLVPTLSADEVKFLLSSTPGTSLPDSIRQKAVAHAMKRIEAGLSPFL